MTSTTTGLPDRYRPLDQVGPDEPTPTGVIQCWRAKDRVLNRDVAIRVHTPAGPAAHAWISRALTAGGLATPALAMVYDASEGTGGAAQDMAPGGAAYVVNEWIDGETLAERLTRGPMPEREVRTVLRRLAEGVAEAHRVGLAVGGLTPENVVLRPNGLVGLRAVPAATRHHRRRHHRARRPARGLPHRLPARRTPRTRPAAPPTWSRWPAAPAPTEPGQGLSSVGRHGGAAGRAPPRPRRGRSGPTSTAPTAPRRHRQRLAAPAPRASSRGGFHAAVDLVDESEAVRLDPHALPPVPGVRPVTQGDTALSPTVLGGDTIDAGSVTPRGSYAGAAAGLPAAPQDRGWGDRDDSFGVLSTTTAVTGARRPVRPTPTTTWTAPGVTAASSSACRCSLCSSSSASPGGWARRCWTSPTPSTRSRARRRRPARRSPRSQGSGSAAAGAAIPIVTGEVFDPFGDGEPENDHEASPWRTTATPPPAWSTAGVPRLARLRQPQARRRRRATTSASAQALSGVTIATTSPGCHRPDPHRATTPADSLDGSQRRPHGTLTGHHDLAFDKPVHGPLRARVDHRPGARRQRLLGRPRRGRRPPPRADAGGRGAGMPPLRSSLCRP